MFNSIISTLSPSSSRPSTTTGTTPTGTLNGSPKKKRHRRKKSKSSDNIIDNEEKSDGDSNEDDDEDESLQDLVRNMKMGGKNQSYSKTSSNVWEQKSKKTISNPKSLISGNGSNESIASTISTSPPSPPSPPAVVSTRLPPSPVNLPPPPPELTPFEFCVMCFESLKASYGEEGQPQSNSNCPRNKGVCVGMYNTGNTCFINCLLQAILAIEPFSSFLMDITQRCVIPSQIPSSLPFWKEFITFIDSVVSASSKPENSASAVVAPTEFLVSLVSEFRQKQLKSNPSEASVTTHSNPSNTLAAYFSQPIGNHGPSRTTSNSQADAMEFYTFLLDSLHEEMRGVDCTAWLKSCHVTDAFSGQVIDTNNDEGGWEEVGKGKIKVSIDENQSQQVATEVIQSSVISQTFHGSLRSTVMYERKKSTSVTYQRFHCLQLDVRGHSSNVVSLPDALLSYFSEEVISNERSNRVSKLLTIEQSPRVLVLQLKRFQYDHKNCTSVKIKANVSFSSTLVIPPSCISTDLLSKLNASAQKRNAQRSKIYPQQDVTMSEEAQDKIHDDEPKAPKISRKARRKKNAEKAVTPGKIVPGMVPKQVQPRPIVPVVQTPSASVNSVDLRYTLQAVVLHHGDTANSGHYTTLVRRRSGSVTSCEYFWYHIDDRSVSKVTDKYVFEATQSSVYILFYSLDD